MTGALSFVIMVWTVRPRVKSRVPDYSQNLPPATETLRFA
jgi:hypothetical protein